MANIKKVFNSAIVKAEKQVIPHYTAKLRNHATSYGWPADITNHIKISHNGTGHSISYPQKIEEAVLTLEYGTQHVPPAPALRTFILGVK